MRVDAATQFRVGADSASTEYNRTGDLKCHPLALQHCQFNPQLKSFFLVGSGKILKEYFCQCDEIFIWPKQLAKSGQVQICGFLLWFATIQIQTSSRLLQQVNLTWNHVHFMKSKILCSLGWQKWNKFDFFKSFSSFVVLGRSTGNHQFGNARQDCHECAMTAAWMCIQRQTQNLLGQVYHHSFFKWTTGFHIEKF